ncbi:hypothetical protein ACRJ4B_06955 [Streptomyces sp. GTA36]
MGKASATQRGSPSAVRSSVRRKPETASRTALRKSSRGKSPSVTTVERSLRW